MEFIGREDYKGIQPFYHPTLVPVEDAVFQAAMLTLIYTERVGKAWRMYEVRRKLDHLTPEMKQTVEDIRLFRKAATHYEFREMKEAETIVDDLLKKYPDSSMRAMINLHLNFTNPGTSGYRSISGTIVSSAS